MEKKENTNCQAWLNITSKQGDTGAVIPCRINPNNECHLLTVLGYNKDYIEVIEGECIIRPEYKSNFPKAENN